MKIIYQVLLTNIGLCVVIALIFAFSQRTVNANDFLMMFGLSCLGVAVLDLLISIILFIAGKENHERAQGFLLSCGVLLLVGFTVCTTAFRGINYR